MKFTKKELKGIIKICDAVSKMKDRNEVYKDIELDKARKIVHDIWDKIIRFRETRVRGKYYTFRTYKGDTLADYDGDGKVLYLYYNKQDAQKGIF